MTDHYGRKGDTRADCSRLSSRDVVKCLKERRREMDR